MIDRSASVVVCDDLLVALNGKFTSIGMYMTDIFIPTDPTFVNQLVFLFFIQTSIDDPIESLALEAVLPGAASPSRLQLSQPVMPSFPIIPGRKALTLKWPLLVTQAILRPGRIEAKVIHEKGEIVASGAPWISVVGQPLPSAPH